MKLVSLLIFVFCGILLNAQPTAEYLIFNTNGRIKFIRGTDVLEKIQGEIFLEKDVLTIIDGGVTIINRMNKRITIEEPGTYNYNGIAELMQKAESSLSNRYFIYVWEKMNKSHEPVTISGGVIRGDNFFVEPMDSIIILSDKIRVSVKNKSDLDYTLLIKSEEFNLIRQDTFYEDITVNLSDINNGKPGKYYWEIKIPNVKGPARRCFLIPDAKTRNKMLKEYKKNIAPFSSFDEELKNLLVEEYLKYNKIYL